jgi:hypothetical protein
MDQLGAVITIMDITVVFSNSVGKKALHQGVGSFIGRMAVRVRVHGTECGPTTGSRK